MGRRPRATPGKCRLFLAFVTGWQIGEPDAVIPIPEHKLDAKGPDEYTYITVPTNFTEDKWVTPPN